MEARRVSCHRQEGQGRKRHHLLGRRNGCEARHQLGDRGFAGWEDADIGVLRRSFENDHDGFGNLKPKTISVQSVR